MLREKTKYFTKTNMEWLTMYRHRILPLLIVYSFSNHVFAEDNQEEYALSPLEVTSTRGFDSLTVNPAAVTVVDREEIEKQTAFGANIGSILAKTVPGMGVASEGFTSLSQTLRGRSLFVLIDGIPQTLSLRDGLHSLNAIDPSSIERIEVIRGSTGVYGFGGTGGIINIITRKSAKGAPVYTSEIKAGFSTEHVDDSYRYGLSQSVTGSEGKLDYFVKGSFESKEAFFDADGDRIPPDPNGQGGIADAQDYDLLAKLGYDIDINRRLELMANYYDLEQDTDYILEPGIYGVQKTRAVKGERGGKNEGTENLNLSLTYLDSKLTDATSLQSQFYYRDFQTRFGFFPAFYPGGGQSYTDSERAGARFDLETDFDLLAGSKVLWGLDLLHEKTSQPLEDGRIFVPEMTQDSVAPFAQVEINVTDKWSVSGGLRYEKFWFEVDDYTTVFGADVEGGKLDYDETVFNAGTRYQFSKVWSATASFSQGFNVPEIGRVLRQPVTGTSIRQIRPEPQVVDNYELGVEALWDKTDMTLSLFYSESDLGTNLAAANANEPIPVLRSPEKIYGVESTLNFYPTQDLTLGGTLTWMEGKVDSDDSGSYEEYLAGDRISPFKLTAYVEHEFNSKWSNRLQALYVGDRDRFSGQSGFGRGEVKSYTIVDLLSRYKMENSSVSLAFNNLLNEDYFPVISQIYNFDTQYTTGPGRSVMVTYQHNW